MPWQTENGDHWLVEHKTYTWDRLCKLELPYSSVCCLFCMHGSIMQVLCTPSKVQIIDKQGHGWMEQRAQRRNLPRSLSMFKQKCENNTCGSSDAANVHSMASVWVELDQLDLIFQNPTIFINNKSCSHSLRNNRYECNLRICCPADVTLYQVRQPFLRGSSRRIVSHHFLDKPHSLLSLFRHLLECLRVCNLKDQW